MSAGSVNREAALRLSRHLCRWSGQAHPRSEETLRVVSVFHRTALPCLGKHPRGDGDGQALPSRLWVRGARRESCRKGRRLRSDNMAALRPSSALFPFHMCAALPSFLPSQSVWSPVSLLAKNHERSMLVKRACLQCVSREASARLQENNMKPKSFHAHVNRDETRKVEFVSFPCLLSRGL